MARFFQVRRRQESMANIVTTFKDHGAIDVGNQPRLGVVKQIRKRVEKRWPSSTKTRLSVQMPTGSTTTEDTDEVSEKKLPHSVELVAEIGTDGRYCDQRLSGKQREFTVADRQRLSTIQEGQSKSQPKKPLSTKNVLRKGRSHTEEATTTIHKTIPDVVVSPKKRDSIAKNQRCVPATITPTQSPVSLVTTLETKLRNLDGLRKVFSRAKLQQESDSLLPVSPRCTTPIQPLSFWCQPVFSCSQQTARHLLPFGSDDDEDDYNTIQEYVSSHSSSTLHEGGTFLDNVINHLVGEDSQEESTVADTDIESLLDDDTTATSVFMPARPERRQHSRSAKGKSKILNTLGVWDELEDDLGEYNPDDRVGENMLSFEFSTEESWAYTDDDYTEMTEFTEEASAFTSD